MNNFDAEKIWDMAIKDAELIQIIQPVVEAMERDPYGFAFTTIKLLDENEQLKKQLEDIKNKLNEI